MEISPETLLECQKSSYQPSQYPAKNICQEGNLPNNIFRYIIPMSAFITGAKANLDGKKLLFGATAIYFGIIRIEYGHGQSKSNGQQQHAKTSQEASFEERENSE